MENYLSLEAFDELVEDLKNLRRDLLSGRSINDIHANINNLSKKVDKQSHKATKSILLLKPEKSLTAERTCEKISSLLSDLKQKVITNMEINEIIQIYDLILSNISKMGILLRKSVESPNPIVKKIIEITESSTLSLKSKTIIKTVKIKRKLDYTQSKISSFTEKSDLHDN